jgi:hypothetical protein
MTRTYREIAIEEMPRTSSSAERMLVPVVLPSGRARDLTSPAATMSSVLPRIGIVAAACRWMLRRPIELL